MPLVSLGFIALLISADQFIKHLVSVYLKPIGHVTIIDGFFQLDYLENTGAAFGILKDHRWIFILLTIIYCIAMLVILFKYNHKLDRLSNVVLVLLMAGGVGNLIDRIARGYVIDYLNFPFFGYVFNLADCCVVIGTFLLLLWFIKSQAAEKKQDDKITPSED